MNTYQCVNRTSMLLLKVTVGAMIVVSAVVGATALYQDPHGSQGQGGKVIEALSKKNKKKRSRRASERTGWFNRGGYLSDRLGIGKSGDNLDIPRGYRQDYIPSDEINAWHSVVGCATNRYSKNCADKNNIAKYYSPIMLGTGDSSRNGRNVLAVGIRDDAKAKFNIRRANHYDDVRERVSTNMGEANADIMMSYPTTDDFSQNDAYANVRGIIADPNRIYITDVSHVNYATDGNALYAAADEMKTVVTKMYVESRAIKQSAAIDVIEGMEVGEVDGTVDVDEPPTVIEYKIKYEDPRSRGEILDTDTWKLIKTEVLNSGNNRADLAAIENDIVDAAGNVTRSFDQFMVDYQSKYTELSAPVETVHANAARENIRLKSAIYPTTRGMDDGIVEGTVPISNMTKEGMGIMSSPDYSSDVTHMGGPSSYQTAYPTSGQIIYDGK